MASQEFGGAESWGILPPLSSDRIALDDSSAYGAIVDYLCEEKPGDVPFAYDIVWSHWSLKRRFEAHGFEGIRNARTIWTRVRYYVDFPTSTEIAWKNSLIKELETLYAPVTGKRVRELVNQLDAHEFRIREQATNELLQLGITAETGLLDALRSKLSIEAEERVRRNLKRMPKDVPASHNEAGMLPYLELKNSAEAREILISLTRNMPNAWIAKEASAILKRKTPP